MVLFMDILSAVLSLIFLMGLIGDKDKDNKPYYTIGFVCCMIVIVLLNNR